MRKLSTGILFLLASLFAKAQNGLEGIIVEKYYVSNAADSVGSIGILPVGSVTYRIYADMLPGYKFQAAYGVGGHALLISTSTSFFNNEDRGATTPTYTKTQARGNSVMLDSWISVGAGCSANFGVLKTEDDLATGGATVINNTVPAILQNNDPAAGIPLTTQDGLFAGAPASVTLVGITIADLSMFDATSQAGNSFTTSNGSWASLTGSTGANPTTNKVLIMQMTTNGAFHFELNLQIGTPTGGVENYVAANPVAGEITIPSLTGTFGGSNINPTVSITSPANGASFLTGATVNIAATANDADGTVSSVEFFVDGILIGTDNSSPYTATYTAGAAGTHSITARATDNGSGQTTSTPVSINVTSNTPPVCSITSPANASSFITGANVNITANASDNGSVASVEFFVDGVSIGIDNTSAYSMNYTALAGAHILTARATDNLGLQTTSAGINISVGSNNPPTVSITAPVNGAIIVAPAQVTITATAGDPDGTISNVEFYVNGNLVGSDNSSPYSFNWTSVAGPTTITAKAFDNASAQTTSAGVQITVANAGVPYTIVSLNNSCSSSNFCLPVNAVTSVSNVIGYDIALNYNIAKVHPTGIITVGNALITSSYVDAAYTDDAVNGVMHISLYFNGSAPANAAFAGTGNLMCVEFAKNAGFNSIDSATFSISSLLESYFSGTSTKSVDPGNYKTYRDSLFSSRLSFWQNNTGLAYNNAAPSQYLITNIYGNNATCTSKSVASVQPDVNGLFVYNVANGADITIERDINGTISVQPVVNGFDALLVRRALMQDPTYVPSVYEMISMDVNLDGRLSAGDVSQINQRAVLMIPEFKQAWNYNAQGVSNGQPSKDWLFIDSTTLTNNANYLISSTFPQDNGTGYSIFRIPQVPFCLPAVTGSASACPTFVAASYKGILIGDINGNFATVGSGGTFRLADVNTVNLDLTGKISQDGYLDIPVRINSDMDVNALDVSLEIDPSVLKFESVIDLTNSLQLLANYNENDQTVRVTSNSVQKYDLSAPVVVIRFKVLNGSLSKDQIKTTEGFINGERVRVNTGEQSNQDILSGWVKLYPNPASTNFSIEVSDDSRVEIVDLEGRKLFDENLYQHSNKVIDAANLQNGVYLVKISNDKFTSIKRVIINK
jgi:hypothetical protein